MITLTRPAISERNREEKEQELILEFLRAYFTGQPHDDDAGQPVTFMDAAVEFNQVDVRTLAKPLIHWTFAGVNRRKQPDGGGMAIILDGLSTVFLQVTSGGKDNQQEHLCRQLGDQFAELLDSKAVLALAAKGIHQLRLMRGPTPLTMPGLHTRVAIIKTHMEFIVPRR